MSELAQLFGGNSLTRPSHLFERANLLTHLAEGIADLLDLLLTGLAVGSQFFLYILDHLLFEGFLLDHHARNRLA